MACNWRGGFIFPLFFIAAALAHPVHLLLPATNEAVLACGLMAAVNSGVTKTHLGSTLVVPKMAGLVPVPPIAIAGAVVLLVMQRSGLLESQKERGEPRPSQL